MKKSRKVIPYYIHILVLVFIFSFPAMLRAQEITRNNDVKSNLREKIFFGGGFGLQFGNATLIDISPIIGYKVFPRLGMGLGTSYKYYRIKNYYGNDNHLTVNVGGGSLFARYLILDNIFAHAEYEKLIYKTKTFTSGTDIQVYSSALVGGGYRQMIGDRVSTNFMILWNLNDTPDSPYTNPIIRVGFNVGL